MIAGEKIATFVFHNISGDFLIVSMNDTNYKQEYRAPIAKVITIEPQNLVCQSPNGNEPMEERDNGQYGDWGN